MANIPLSDPWGVGEKSQMGSNGLLTSQHTVTSESIKLLANSNSDSDSEIPEFSPPKRKVRFKKRLRPGYRPKTTPRMVQSCTSHCARGLAYTGIFIICIAFLVMVMLFVKLNKRVNSLQKAFQDIEAGNKNTPEALHNIHTDLKNFQQNISTFGSELEKAVENINILREEVQQLRDTASSLQKSIDSAPEIKAVPKKVSSLTKSVADIGSRVSSMDITVNELKKQQTDLQKTAQTALQDLENAKKDIKELWNATEAQRERPASDVTASTHDALAVLQRDVLKLAGGIDEINETFSAQLKEIDLQHKQLGAVNGTVTQLVQDLSKQQEMITDLQNFVHDNLTSKYDLTISSKGLSNDPFLNSSIKDHLNQMLNKAAQELMLQKLNTESPTVVDRNTWNAVLNEAQQIVIIYTDMLHKLNISLPVNGTSVTVFEKLLNFVLASKLQSHENDIKKLKEGSNHLWEQYSQVINTQTVIQSTLNGTLIKLQEVDDTLRAISSSSNHGRNSTNSKLVEGDAGPREGSSGTSYTHHQPESTPAARPKKKRSATYVWQNKFLYPLDIR